ncbi:sialidase family protein [Actinomadura verrucosospora]|uniref:BNR/Asp-box repeat-containing protein n=1 Tax=Actinomadura verrucosospora TaxID=46165 RepID=A0A7D3ZCQ4_ACTVE|nr:sialidase family protein [Actinomadura verrucosospora]QKG19217.1 BNR/Asp-box repeat-containing protein [Actinomadura verrucosospora]
MRMRRTLGSAAAGALLLAALSVAGPGAQAQGFGYDRLTPIQKRHVSGALAEALGRRAEPRAVTGARPASAPSCGGRHGANVKVDQDCLTVTDQPLAGRGQAQNETWIAADPNDPRHLLAGYNDYRRGDGTCGVSRSADGGRTWSDTTAPNGFVSGAAFGGKPREYFQSGGDTSVAWDTRGNAYLSCQEFKRGSAVTPDADQSSGFYVYRSTGNAGASFNFPGRPVAEHDDTAGAGNFLLDKQLMTVDAHTRSPYRDRVYVTWTTFAEDGTGYIYGAYSADYGEHFSAPVLISSDSALCPQAYGIPTPHGRCNNNQFSQPVTAPDGTLYVAWANYNVAETGSDNGFQVLVAASKDGGATFSAPVKAAGYYELPDCDTYQGEGKDPGRACVPEKGTSTDSIFRATNYPNITVDPANPKRVVVTVGSYINRDSDEASGCTPAGLTPADEGLGALYTGVKTGGCNNGIVLSSSTDGAATFTGTTTDVRKLPLAGTGAAQARTDQYWQGTVFNPRGELVTAYYDRQYGTDETTGFSDITVAASRDLTHFTAKRATTSSMPPPSQFNGQFYGDYIMLDATATTAYPAWPDTRAAALVLCPGTGTPGHPPALCTAAASNASVANDQQISTAAVPLH